VPAVLILVALIPFLPTTTTKIALFVAPPGVAA
jgi:hypothetical protein